MQDPDAFTRFGRVAKILGVMVYGLSVLAGAIYTYIHPPPPVSFKAFAFIESFAVSLCFYMLGDDMFKHAVKVSSFFWSIFWFLFYIVLPTATFWMFLSGMISGELCDEAFSIAG